MKRLVAVLLLAAAGASFAKPMNHLRVLALVSGHAVTNRMVQLDAVLDNPASYTSGAFRAPDNANQALERVITQHMVLEESRLLGNEKVNEKTLNEELFRVKKALGPKGWPALLGEFDVREVDVRRLLEDKFLVQQAIEARVKALGALPEGQSRDQAIREAIQTWLSQLRARYRVSRMRYDDKR